MKKTAKKSRTYRTVRQRLRKTKDLAEEAGEKGRPVSADEAFSLHDRKMPLSPNMQCHKVVLYRFAAPPPFLIPIDGRWDLCPE